MRWSGAAPSQTQEGLLTCGDESQDPGYALRALIAARMSLRI
jgi:hypothetical protein